MVEVAACIWDNPCGTLPRALVDKTALKGAYRLFSHPEVTHEALLAPHVARTRQLCQQPGAFLLIEDTTALSFTHREALAGMGPLTKKTSQGVLAHTCLAARIAHWGDSGQPQVTLAGVFGQECSTLKVQAASRKHRRRANTPNVRESQRWARAVAPDDGAGPRHTM